MFKYRTSNHPSLIRTNERDREVIPYFRVLLLHHAPLSVRIANAAVDYEHNNDSDLKPSSLGISLEFTPSLIFVLV